MRRREFLGALGGAAAMWPRVARAQERMRRIGWVTGMAEGDPEFQSRFVVLRETLQQLGWTEGRNIRFEYRWSSAGADVHKYAADLVALAPDVILANGSQNIAALQQASRDVPIVFLGVVDPVGAGFVASLARPGGNTTGFTLFEYGMSVKWLELLKEVAPRVKRVAVFRESDNAAGIGQFAAMQGAASSLGVELIPVGGREAGEIESAIATFARGPNEGLVVTIGGAAIRHRKLIGSLAARHRLPAVYPGRFFAIDGGLISYGPDVGALYGRAAGYIDRVLKGEKPADLPVQAPTKYELVVNLKTAKALGLDVPLILQQRADEVIE